MGVNKKILNIIVVSVWRGHFSDRSFCSLQMNVIEFTEGICFQACTTWMYYK